MKYKQITLSVALILLSIAAISQPATFSPKGIGGGGALFFPRVNPANDNEFYVACDMSEMFHSTDFGNTYSQLHFSKLQAMNISTYEFTNNSNIAYSNFNDNNSGYPVKTTDGGNTWVQLPGYNADMDGVYAMKANYNNPNQLLMNYYGEIVISNDGGNTFQVVKDATDNGVGLIMGGVFFDGNNIYIGTNEGVLVSTDGGTLFTTMTTTGIPAGQIIWQFAGAKAGSTTRFTCITGGSADVYNGLMPYDYYGLAAGVYTMDNANGTWQSASAGMDFNADFVMYVAMAENDINTIYLGGNDGDLDAPLVYKSADGGTSWAKVFKSTNNQNVITGWSGDGGDKQWSWGESCFGISVAPNNANKVLFGDYSFIHVSSDGGDNWKQAYVNNADEHAAGAQTPTQQTYHSIGLENTSCWQVDWQGPAHMLSAFSDLGMIRSTDTGNSWGFTYNGLSVNSTYRIAKTAGKLFAATSGIHDMYQSTRLKDAQLDANDANGEISYSTDGGANWSLLHNFGHPVFWIAINPNDSNQMYVSVIDHNGDGGIWVTSDLSSLGGSTWTQLSAPPRTEGHPATVIVLNDGKLLCSYSGRIGSDGTFTASSGVFLYDPSTSTWADKSDDNMDYWTMDVVVDTADATQSTWYAAVYTHWGATSNEQGGLYKTTNRGTTWVKLTGSQFDRVTSMTLNPQNHNQAYLTTETQGLWVSNNMNSATPTWALVESYPFRQPERVFFNPYNQNEMWVTSFGNGMKVGNLADTSLPAAVAGIAVQPQQLSAYPNPTTGAVTVDIPTGLQGKTIYVYDMNGRMKTRLVTTLSTASIDMRTWASGIYFIYCGDGKATVVKH